MPTPAHAGLRANRSLHLPLTILILAVLVLYARRKPSPTSFNALRPLPETYAICTEGKHVYTVPSEGIGETECVVVKGNRVVDTGSLGKLQRRKDQLLHIIHLPKGYSVTPGLTDSHAHPLEYGHSRALQLQGCSSVAEIVHRVEAYVDLAKPAPGTWIEGMGWDQNLWEGKDFPSAADLDTPKLRGIPISLKRIDVHADWVSPAILALLPSLPTTVEGGEIVRDAKGRPTGVFIDNAIDLIDAIRPAWTDAQRQSYLDIMARDAVSKGLVGVHDAGVLPADMAFFERLGEDGKLPMRFYTMLLCPDRRVFCGNRAKVESSDSRFRLQSVKLFGDGALGSRGAALIDDYSDKPGWKGFMLAPEETWAPLVKEYYDSGWQVNVHCIGDRANHVVLDAMEAAIGKDLDQGRQRRLRIEHAQIFTPEDIERAARLGVIGSYQPTHATSDMWYAEDRLGPDRIQGAYAWRTYLSNGGRITLGSDFPVESIDPLKGFYAAVTRRAEDGSSPHGKGGWYPAQKLSRVEALRGFTFDPAFASFSNDTGSLTPGMRFDAVIWDDDLMNVDPDDMLDVRVVATIIDGEIVFGQLGGKNP